MKRSPSLRLLVMALPFALVACDSADNTPAPRANPAPKADAGLTAESFYTTPEDCAKAGEDAVACRKAFDEAQKTALATAPRFTSSNACEAEFGGCIEVPATAAAPAVPGTAPAAGAPAQAGGGGGSFFMPMMLGYMMGSSGSGMNSASSGFSPVYRNRAGGYTQAFRDNSGTGYRSTPVRSRPNVKSVPVTRRTPANTPSRATPPPPPRANPPKATPVRSSTPVRSGFGSRSGGGG